MVGVTGYIHAYSSFKVISLHNLEDIQTFSISDYVQCHIVMIIHILNKF